MFYFGLCHILHTCFIICAYLKYFRLSCHPPTIHVKGKRSLRWCLRSEVGSCWRWEDCLEGQVWARARRVTNSGEELRLSVRDLKANPWILMQVFSPEGNRWWAKWDWFCHFWGELYTVGLLKFYFKSKSVILKLLWHLLWFLLPQPAVLYSADIKLCLKFCCNAALFYFSVLR